MKGQSIKSIETWFFLLRPYERCIFYGISLGLSFYPPFPGHFQIVSFCGRLLLSSLGLLGLAKEQFSVSSFKALLENGFAFGCAFWSISLLGLYKAFWVAHFSLVFLPGLLGIAGFLGLCLGLFLGTLKFFPHRENRLAFSFFFAFLWVAHEVFRGLICPQFPWNTLAHLFCFENFYFSLSMLQSVRFGGVYFLSMLWCLFLISWFSRSSCLIKLMSLSWAASWLYGCSVLYFPAKTLPERTLHIGLIQPNVSQRRKLQQTESDAILRHLLNLVIKIQQGNGKPLDLIICPETAITHLLFAGSPFFQIVRSALKSKESFLLFGADRAVAHENSLIWYNSLFVLSQQKVLAVYDKKRLLPFGEYLPFRALYPSFFTNIWGRDCTPGKRENSISVGKIPAFVPKICSESMHKSNVTPDLWIVQILNDGWFATPILWQHLAVDRLRAVELHKPLVRVSNTGISAVLDAYGRIVHSLIPHQEGISRYELKLPIPEQEQGD
jgi:apolipoprotein N-acyltransferase